RKCADETPAIRRAAATAWEVDRGLLDYYATHWGELNRLGWVGKHEGPDGKPDGFRVAGIRCGTPLHQGGFRNGDVVHRVNGQRVHNIAQAVKAYLKVRGKDRIRVELTREGEPLVLNYRLE